MKTVLAVILTVFVAIPTANSYILLTANLEDIQTMAKQLAASPVVDQINRIWRRASNQFNLHLAKNSIQKRTNEDLDGDDLAREDRADDLPEPERSYQGEERESYARRRSQNNDDLVALGKNASLYLKSIKKIFETV